MELWDSMGEEGGWNPRFSRPFNDWEVEEVERLLETIQGRRLNFNLEDRCCGKRLRTRIFLLNAFIVLLILEVQFSFQRTLFGALVFLLKRVFLLGKLLGVRC